MLDLQLFRDRRFSVASAGITLTLFAMFGTFFLMANDTTRELGGVLGVAVLGSVVTSQYTTGSPACSAASRSRRGPRPTAARPVRSPRPAASAARRANSSPAQRSRPSSTD